MQILGYFYQRYPGMKWREFWSCTTAGTNHFCWHQAAHSKLSLEHKLTLICLHYISAPTHCLWNMFQFGFLNFVVKEETVAAACSDSTFVVKGWSERHCWINVDPAGPSPEWWRLIWGSVRFKILDLRSNRLGLVTVSHRSGFYSLKLQFVVWQDFDEDVIILFLFSLSGL